MQNRSSVLGAAVLFCALVAATTAPAAEPQLLQEVSPAVAEKPQDSLVMLGSAPWDPAILADMKRHQATLGGKPAGDQDLPSQKAYDGGILVGTTKDGGQNIFEWVMPTPKGGDYVVSLLLFSGEQFPGRFGFYAGEKKVESAEFHQSGRHAGLFKSFRISAPPGQEQTRMFLSGDGISLWQVDLSPVTRPITDPEGVIRQLADSSYRTVLRAAHEPANAPSCVILAPSRTAGSEARLAHELADSLKLRVAEEPELTAPFPRNPAAQVAGPDTNFILLSAGFGGPIVQAMRRADLIAENFAVPGPGGYAIRTVPRPFDDRANVIVISGGDEAGLIQAIKAFQPALDAKTGELVWDRFLVDHPGEKWAKLRSSFYNYTDDSPFWDRETAQLERGLGANPGGEAPARNFIHHTGDIANLYWLTGNNRFAQVFKLRMFKMQDDNLYGGAYPSDCHMELYGLMRGWARVEEAPVFTSADRLRITNYLLHQCVLGGEGFGHAYNAASRYFGPIRMRHNHQTILACGMMQSYLYFSRLYGLGCTAIWKTWCDDLIHEATGWGHGPENSFHYELKMFREVADMLHYQGLRAADNECSRTWPAVALRYMAARGSLGLGSCYGDCGNAADYKTMDPQRWDFFGAVMRDDLAWPPAQFAIDQMIRGYRDSDPSSDAAGELHAYLTGSTDVGGLLPPPTPEALAMVRQMLGLQAIPMTEGYWSYMTGQVGNPDFWRDHRRPEAIPYAKTADKVVYRSGWGLDDDYMMLETLGWAEHGHMELGAIVQYCQGGRLWVVKNGYDNWGPEHCSTLEVKRDGKPAWGQFEGKHGRFFDFRTGPQMFEIVQLDQPNRTAENPGAGPFHLVCRAKDLAGATWLRSVQGGDNKGLRVEDTLTAQEPGEYQIVFRLRLLGRVEGADAAWKVSQVGAALPVALDGLQPGDSIGAVPAVPEARSYMAIMYPWYAFIQGMTEAGGRPAGTPWTIEWKRTVRLTPGQTTTFRAALGPSQKTDSK